MNPRSPTHPPSGPGLDALSRRACGHDHRLVLHEDDAYLAGVVASFLGEALDAGGSAVVVATAEHRQAFVAALTAAGVDVADHRAGGHLVLLDAATTLTTFMTDDGPDPERFAASIGAALSRSELPGAPVHVFGEMVALLWAGGDAAAAIALEDLWNDLASTHDFTLLCAYPMHAFDDPSLTSAFARVCEQHGTVVPPEDFARIPAVDDDARARAVAHLQREVRCLRRALATAVDAAGPTTMPPTPHDRRTPPPGTSLPGCAARYTDALETGDADAATHALEDALAVSDTPAAVYDEVVKVAMHAVGKMWESGRLTPADEHLATVVCQRALAAVYPLVLPQTTARAARVLVAGVEHETHALAPRLVADTLEGLGHDVVHLGPDVPADALGAAVARHRPALVALSMTIEAHEPQLRRAIAAIRRNHPDLPILLGGQGIGPRWAASGWPVATSVGELHDLIERVISNPSARPAVPAPGGGDVDRRAPRGGGGEPIARVAAELGELARQHARSARSYRVLALEDPLTGLANRRAFDDRIGAMIEEGPGLLLAIDVDGLKAVNDAHGHDAGDALLVDVARAIASAVRPEDLVARLGGDEFAVLVREDGVDAHALADRIRDAVEARGATTVSIGIAPLGTDARATVLAADRALYDAKTGGRNAVAGAGHGVTLPAPRSPRARA